MAGKKGFGAKLAYDSGSSTFVELAGMTKLRPFGIKVDEIDMTSHDSAATAGGNGIREKDSGLLDNGQCQAELNYNEKNTGHIYIQDNAGVLKTWKVTFGGATPKTATFSGFVSALNPEVPHDSKETESVVISISGAITWA